MYNCAVWFTGYPKRSFEAARCESCNKNENSKPVSQSLPSKRGMGIADVFWGLVLFFACPFLTSFIVFFFAALFGNQAEIEPVLQGRMTLLLLNTTVAGIAAAFVGWPLYLSYRRGKGSMSEDFGLDWKMGDLFWGVVGGLCCIGSMFVAGFVWYATTGSGDIPTNSGFLRSFQPNVLESLNLFLLIAVWTPVAEEIFFRGFALRVLEQKFGKWAAMVLTSLIFGLLHVPIGAGIGTCLFLFGVTFGYGLIFASLAIGSGGRLGASIFAHCFLNSAVTLYQFSS